MAKWGLWSTTAGSNSSTPPDGWPEGQAPSTVNDCAREMMAQIKAGISDIQFIDLGLTPTQTGNTTFTLAGNQSSFYEYGRRVKASVGANTLYGTVISSSFTTNTGITLRLDAGLLTASMSAVAVGFPSQNNGALPEVAYRDYNYFINPLMEIWQRGNGPYSLSVGNAIVFNADRWRVQLNIVSVGPVVAVSRAERSANASNVPALAQAGVLINSSILISSNAALTGLSATDALFFEQTIEGFNYREMAGKPITVSFWVKSNLTGTYCLALQNSGGTLSQVQPYSISASDTWERKTISFVKPPLTGAWDYSSGIGLRARFALVAGSGFQAGAGNWTATNVIATSSQVNFLAATGRNFMFTAPKIQEGNQATPLVPVDISTEFNKCTRYCQVVEGGLTFLALTDAANQAYCQIPLIGVMRATPSASYPLVSQMNLSVFGVGAVSVSAIATGASSGKFFGMDIKAVGSPGLGLNACIGFAISAGSKIVLDSEP